MGGGVRGALRGAGMVPLICMWLRVSSGCVKTHGALLTSEHFPLRLLHAEAEGVMCVARSPEVPPLLLLGAQYLWIAVNSVATET